MVVIRNVFRLKFGKAREAVALFKEGMAIQKRVGLDFSTRLLTDVTGPSTRSSSKSQHPIWPLSREARPG